MTGQNYNGWANYETWLINLWLTNDSADLEAAEEAAREGEEALRALVEDSVGLYDLPAGLASDLLRAALSAANWRELTESFLESVQCPPPSSI